MNALWWGLAGLGGLLGLVGLAGLARGSRRPPGRDAADPLAEYPFAKERCVPNADNAHTPLMLPVITPEMAGLPPDQVPRAEKKTAAGVFEGSLDGMSEQEPGGVLLHTQPLRQEDLPVKTVDEAPVGLEEGVAPNDGSGVNLVPTQPMRQPDLPVSAEASLAARGGVESTEGRHRRSATDVPVRTVSREQNAHNYEAAVSRSRYTPVDEDDLAPVSGDIPSYQDEFSRRPVSMAEPVSDEAPAAVEIPVQADGREPATEDRIATGANWAEPAPAAAVPGSSWGPDEPALARGQLEQADLWSGGESSSGPGAAVGVAEPSAFAEQGEPVDLWSSGEQVAVREESPVAAPPGGEEPASARDLQQRAVPEAESQPAQLSWEDLASTTDDVEPASAQPAWVDEGTAQPRQDTGGQVSPARAEALDSAKPPAHARPEVHVPPQATSPERPDVPAPAVSPEQDLIAGGEAARQRVRRAVSRLKTRMPESVEAAVRRFRR